MTEGWVIMNANMDQYRAWQNGGTVWVKDLDATMGPFEVVIHGCATGADEEARIWAVGMGRKELPFRADWHAHGRAAGPLRNQRMLDHGRPDMVIAFPGGRGTADMTRRARLAGVDVHEVAYQSKGSAHDR